MSDITKVFAYILFILCLVSCAIDKNMKKGEKYLALGEYYDAANEYKKAYSKVSPKEKKKRGDIALKMAYCYERSNQTQKAISAYRNAIRYNTADVNHHLSLARQLLKNGEYKTAITEFQLVLDSMPDNALALNGMKSAIEAPVIKQTGSRYKVKKMDVLNSRRAEFSPMLQGDQFEQIYFSSTRNEAEGDELSGITGTKPADIFVSVKDDKGKWSKPEQVSGGLNTAFDEGVCCFDPSGKEMYLTQCVTDPSYPRYAKIIKASRSDAAWEKGSDLEITKDTLSSFAHPAITPDGEWLYFCSDMPGGKGGFDIWRVRITSTGLGGIENLGPPVNTEGDEMFPTFRPNGDLYFSSNGHPGMGGLDIFIATVGDDHRYHLEHPGYPLNSQGDDFGMTFEGPYNRGYFSSNRGDGRGWDHIYSFENPEIVQSVVGWVYEQDGYELTDAEIIIIGDDGTNQKCNVRGDGSFQYAVKPNVQYLFLATCKGYLNKRQEFTVAPSSESEEYTLQFPLAPLTSSVLVENIFYDFAKSSLRDESQPALQKLIETLNENPSITIELSAHCDYKGSDEYNKRLSQQRADAVVAYLVEHGIQPDRLTPVGYGEERPKTVKPKLAEKLPWLKAGDVLTEEFIKSLDVEKQDVCNQLNRRTEFRVLRTTYDIDEHEQVNPQENKNINNDNENFILE